MALTELATGTQSLGHEQIGCAYHTITIENENDGRRTTLVASGVERIGDVIAELYVRLGRDRLDGDQLRWESDGEEVASFAELTLDEYFEFGHCPRLRWVFTSATGGDYATAMTEVTR